MLTAFVAPSMTALRRPNPPPLFDNHRDRRALKPVRAPPRPRRKTRATPPTPAFDTPAQPHPQAAELLAAIHAAVEADDLGVALTLLADNPSLVLPAATVHDLAAKLRMRGMTSRAARLTACLDDAGGSASSVVNLLARRHKTAVAAVAAAAVAETDAGSPAVPVVPQNYLHDVDGRIRDLLADRRLSDALALASAPASKAIHISSQTLQALVRAAAGAGRLRTAEHLLQVDLPARGVPADAASYGHVVDACGRAGNARRALSLLQRSGDFALLLPAEQTGVYARLIDACVRCKDVSLATQVVRRMRDAGIPRCERVYVSLLTGLSHELSLSHALRLLDDMRTDGFQQHTSSAEVFNALILGCSRACRVRDAFRVFDSMASAAEGGSAVRPNLDTYNALLSACARAGLPDRAFEVLRSMSNGGKHSVQPSPKTYNWVVVACAKVGDVDRALQVARRMRKEGIRLNVVTHNNLLEACCNAGRMERAFAMVRDMVQGARVAPNSHTYNTLIRGCGRWGLFDAALRLLGSMQSAGVSPTLITYSVAIDACARAGGPVAADKAFELLADLERAGLEPNVVTCNSLIHACAKGLRADLAFSVLDRMEKARIAPDIVTLCTLVDACGRSGQIERAFNAIDELTGAYDALRPTVPVYNALIHACFKAGDLARMQDALADMRARGLRPNVVTFSTLISAYVATDSPANLHRALDLLQEMRQAGLRPNGMTFTSLIAAYGRVGAVDKAMAMLAEARAQTKPDEELYTSAIVAAICGGRPDLATQLKGEMSRAGYFVPTVMDRMMRRQVGGIERSGAERRAMMHAMEALQIRPRRAALEALIATYAAEADVAAAFDVLPDMERLGYPPNLQTYKKLILACGLSGAKADVARGYALFDRLRERRKADCASFRSHNWHEFYEAVLRMMLKMEAGADGEDPKLSLLRKMTSDCGEEFAREVAGRVCPELVDQM